MATVTGLTAARMLEIEAASVVSGEIDSSGHLILTTHSGTEIDAGNALVAVQDATTAQKGVVELATSAEVAAGTDSARAVTPAALLAAGVKNVSTDLTSLGNRATTLETNVTTLQNEPGRRTRDISPTLAENAADSSYPIGFSQMAISASDDWSVSPTGFVITHRLDADRTVQWFHSIANDNYAWKRRYNLGAWSSWVRIAMASEVTPTSWVAPTLGNSWVNYGVGFSTAGYRKDPGGIVRLRGLIKNGTVNVNATAPVFTLPTGFRPEFNEVFAVACNGTPPVGRLDVLPDGKVAVTVGQNGYVSLDGITFAAAQ